MVLDQSNLLQISQDFNITKCILLNLIQRQTYCLVFCLCVYWLLDDLLDLLCQYLCCHVCSLHLVLPAGQSTLHFYFQTSQIPHRKYCFHFFTFWLPFHFQIHSKIPPSEKRRVIKQMYQHLHSSWNLLPYNL